MQTDKGLSKSTCAEEQGGDNDGFYLAKVGIIIILCNKGLMGYMQGTTVQFISWSGCYPENYVLVNKAHSNSPLVQQLEVLKN